MDYLPLNGGPQDMLDARNNAWSGYQGIGSPLSSGLTSYLNNLDGYAAPTEKAPDFTSGNDAINWYQGHGYDYGNPDDGSQEAVLNPDNWRKTNPNSTRQWQTVGTGAWTSPDGKYIAKGLGGGAYQIDDLSRGANEPSYAWYNPDGSFNKAFLGAKNMTNWQGVLSVIGAAAGFGALGAVAGGAGAAAGAAGEGAASGAGFVGEGAASGVGAWDGALAGSTAGNVGAATAGGAYGLDSGAGGGGGSTLGASSDAGGFVGEGTTSGVPAWDGAAGSGASTSMADTFSRMMANQQVSGAVKNYLLSSVLKAGGGSSGGGNGNSSGGGGMGLNDLVGILGGANDANAQGQAAAKMKEWLLSQSSKMDGYMNPNSPEYNAMWQEMSRKDAAAGRNSQYGVRTSDFLANIAKQKASNTLNFTTGNSRAYADALNQDASKYAGISAALQRALAGGNNNGGVGLQQIINALSGNNGSSTAPRGALDFGTGSGSTGAENQQVLDSIYSQGGAPIDYGADATDESSVWDSILNGWGF